MKCRGKKKPLSVNKN